MSNPWFSNGIIQQAMTPDEAYRQQEIAAQQQSMMQHVQQYQQGSQQNQWATNGQVQFNYQMPPAYTSPLTGLNVDHGIALITPAEDCPIKMRDYVCFTTEVEDSFLPFIMGRRGKVDPNVGQQMLYVDSVQYDYTLKEYIVHSPAYWFWFRVKEVTKIPIELKDCCDLINNRIASLKGA